MAGVIMPGTSRPTNLRLSPEQLRMHVEGDVYHICERLAKEVEGGDRLYMVIHEDHPEPYVLMERTDRGTDEFILRTNTLDARLIQRLQYMLHVPLERRVREFEAEEAAHNEKTKNDELEELYEQFGGDMYRQLHKDGFAHGRSEQYARSGPKVEAARRAR